MSLYGGNQGFSVRYTVVDFAEKFFEEVFFHILVGVLHKLGRILTNWSKTYLREFMNLMELIFHYFASRLNLESPWRFLIVYLKYFYR